MSQAQLLPTVSISASPFQFKGFTIRTQVEDEHLWFVAKDVCAALDIDWSGKTLSVIPDSWQSMGKVPTLCRGMQRVKRISEPAVYKLAFRSNKPEADAFTNWVASEVLPSIRKTGKYEATLPHGDTLTATEQAQLQAIVQAKAGMVPSDMQRKAFAEMWTRFNRHFRIARYAQLPPAKMGEAVEYLVGMEVKSAVAALPSGKHEITESPIQARVLDQFPKDMGTGRKQALKKIEGILKDFYGLRDTVRLFTHPGGYSCGRSMSEKDQYDILLNLYRAADANLAAAYNALEAGYRMGREIGRG